MRSDLSWSAIFSVYVLLALGITYFVHPQLSQITLLGATLVGTLFGLVVYGVYDFTNLAILKGWGLKLAVVDVIWGGVINALVVVIIKLLGK